MKTKILRSALTTTLLTALLFTILSSVLLLGFFQTQIQRELEQDVKQLAISLNRDDNPVQQLQTLVDGGLTGRLTLIGADGMIPSGAVMLRAYQLGGEDLYFDDVHASRGTGRYLLALCWFKYLTGKDIIGNGFSGFDVPVTDTDREIAIQAVNEVLKL